MALPHGMSPCYCDNLTFKILMNLYLSSILSMIIRSSKALFTKKYQTCQVNYYFLHAFKLAILKLLFILLKKNKKTKAACKRAMWEMKTWRYDFFNNHVLDFTCRRTRYQRLSKRQSRSKLFLLKAAFANVFCRLICSRL